MLPNSNRQVLLKSRPAGIPQAENFEIVEGPAPQISERQFLVRNEFLSVEPAMRGWVSAVANYSQPVGIGEVMRSFAAGTVVASKHPGFAEGDRVMGMLGWQQYAVSDGANITRKMKESDLPLSLSLGVLGLNGITAYFGLLDLGEPKPGDTVVVSTAAGAVGSAVGQIAKLNGLPHSWNYGWRGQKQVVPRRVRLRRGDRLQGWRCRQSFGASGAARRRCLFRQYVRRDQRRRLCAARARRAHRHLRHGFSCELGPVAARSTRRAAHSGQARTRAAAC